MPDFHAPFTREELEGRGWVFNGGRMTIPHSGWIIDSFLSTCLNLALTRNRLRNEGKARTGRQ